MGGGARQRRPAAQRHHHGRDRRSTSPPGSSPRSRCWSSPAGGATCPARSPRRSSACSSSPARSRRSGRSRPTRAGSRPTAWSPTSRSSGSASRSCAWPRTAGSSSSAASRSPASCVSAWALAHKVFPGALEPDEVYARLREPFGYWNAVGLMAAMGVPGCLWLGARRAGHAAVNALAYPATGLLIVVMLLAYSRGSLLALLVGCAFWFAAVPLRLRGVAVLAAGAAGGGAGHRLGVQPGRAQRGPRAAGPARPGRPPAAASPWSSCSSRCWRVGLVDRLPARPRGRCARAPAAAPGIAVARRAGAASRSPASCALTASDRGLTGSISHGWTQLTDPNASQPSNEPGRLTAVGSVRARYWNDALKIFRDRPWVGVGAGGYQLARLRYRTDTLDVLHAHGYVVAGARRPRHRRARAEPRGAGRARGRHRRRDRPAPRRPRRCGPPPSASACSR